MNRYALLPGTKVIPSFVEDRSIMYSERKKALMLTKVFPIDMACVNSTPLGDVLWYKFPVPIRGYTGFTYRIDDVICF